MRRLFTWNFEVFDTFFSSLTANALHDKLHFGAETLHQCVSKVLFNLKLKIVRTFVVSANCPVCEPSCGKTYCRQTVLSATYTVDELSCRRSIGSAKSSIGELFLRRTILSTNCLVGETPVGQLSLGQLPVGQLSVGEVSVHLSFRCNPSVVRNG